MKPKRNVEPKYLEIYKQLNKVYPDRPGSVFDQLFKEACLQHDAEERYNQLLADAKQVLESEGTAVTSLFKRMMTVIRGARK